MTYLVLGAALALTILIESAVAALWFRRRGPVYFSVLCNMLTNPLLNLLLWLSVSRWGAGAYVPALAALEAAAVAAEAALMRKLCGLRIGKAFLLSLCMNAASFAAGLALAAAQSAWIPWMKTCFRA